MSYESDLDANTVMKLPVNASLECIGEGVFRKGIEIVGVHPVSVTCFSSLYLSSDGYQALPVSAWGTEYVSANYYLDHYTPASNDTLDPAYYCAIHPRGGEFAVIAAFDSTIVTVVPSTRTLGGAAPGSSYTRTLNRGDIFQVQDGGTRRGESDLTGSRITATRPVGVLSGHVRAGIPYTSESKDHLVEMIPPRTRLGQRHLIAPFRGHKGGDRVRVIATHHTTVVALYTASNPTRIDTIRNAGEFIEIILDKEGVIITSSPVLVAQYCQSNETDSTSTFDPFMITVTPEEQFLRNATIHTLPERLIPGGERKFDHHYVTIVADANVIPTIRVNGETLMNLPGLATGAFPTTTYRWATIELPPDRSFAINGDGVFSGYVFGLGNLDSYGWPIVAGGLPAGPDCVPTITPSGPIALCEGKSVVLDAGIAGSYSWSNGATTRRITVVKAGNYSVTTVDSTGCVGTSAPVSVSLVKIAPVLLSPGGSLALCEGDSMEITLPAGFATYLWSNGSVSRTIVVRNSGSYWATVTTPEGCSALTDTLIVTQYPANIPVITRKGDSLSTESAGSYQWYHDGALLPGETSKSILPLQSGRYTVRTVDWNGCAAESAPFDVTWLGVEDHSVSAPLQLVMRGHGEYVIVGRVAERCALRVEIVDMLGRTVMSRTSAKHGSIWHTISLGDLPAGSYLLRVRHGSAMQIWRVMQ